MSSKKSSEMAAAASETISPHTAEGAATTTPQSGASASRAAAPTAQRAGAAPKAASTSGPTVFRPDRLNLIGAAVMFLICLVFVGYKPMYLFWVLIFPIFFAVWVLRVRTVVSPKGIEAFYIFGSSRKVSWDEFHSIRFSRGGKAYAYCGDGTAPRSHSEERATNVYLPGVSFNSLPALSKATGGRIPDPLTSAKTRADDSVTIIQRDGYAVLATEEEAKAREAAKAEAKAQADTSAPSSDA